MCRHTPSKLRSPSGPQFPSGRKSPPWWQPATWIGLATLLIAGCDQPPAVQPGATATTGTSTGENNIDSTAVAEEPSRPLPDNPSFQLPADWSEQHPVTSPNVKYEAHYLSLAEKQLQINPRDGQGKAMILSVQAIGPNTDSAVWRPDKETSMDRPQSSPVVPASSFQRIKLVFEVAKEGIDEGGVLFVLSDPFWSWSEAQCQSPNAAGYTTAISRHSDVELVPLDGGAAFRVRGRALREGEKIDVVFGAGAVGARVGEYAERGGELMIGIDADGDGTRRWLKQSLRLDISARRGASIVAFGPADTAPGEDIEVSIAIIDPRGNRALWPPSVGKESLESQLSFTIESVGGPPLTMLGLTEILSLSVDPGEPAHFSFVAPQHDATIRLSIRGLGDLDGFEAIVNPIVVRASPMRLVWGDLHGHSQLSDGTGEPADYFKYARDVARLDVIALTDHDHWGFLPLDENPSLANQALNSGDSFNEPGRFVTIPGYEWTNWLHGHRHVLYFDGEPKIFSAIDPATDRPDELWSALRGLPALTFAHHSAGEPIATNWAYPPDPIIEPLTEISSVHGTSEAADAPFPVLGAIAGNFVRDVLERGARLGFIGSGDSHDGHPGLAQVASGRSGLAGIFADSLDRNALLGAMRKRRTFATNGIRPWFTVSIDGTFMGGTLQAQPQATGHQLTIRYEATAPVERIDFIRSGRVASIEGGEALRIELDRRIPRLRPGEFHYVRILQTDGGVAWSSPIFVVDDPAN